MSDHGFHPDHFARNKFRRSQPARRSNIATSGSSLPWSGNQTGPYYHGAGLFDIAPTILTIFGLPIGEDMDGRPLFELSKTPEIETIESWEDVVGETANIQEPDWIRRIGRSDGAIDRSRLHRPARYRCGSCDRKCQCELDYNLARSYMDAGMHGNAIPLLKFIKVSARIPIRRSIGDVPEGDGSHRRPGTPGRRFEQSLASGVARSKKRIRTWSMSKERKDTGWNWKRSMTRTRRKSSFQTRSREWARNSHPFQRS